MIMGPMADGLTQQVKFNSENEYIDWICPSVETKLATTRRRLNSVNEQLSERVMSELTNESSLLSGIKETRRRRITGLRSL
jgi:hypothetical protein